MKNKNALISVSDKTGILEFSRKLVERGVQIYSTGGTARLLAENSVPVTEVSEYTGFPEMMDGRVKTLHPKIHGGLLSRPGHSEDEQSAKEQGIQLFDLVVVNLYPFREVTANPEISLEDAVENIDIGGPSMLRAAAKNFGRVAVITDPSDYEEAILYLDGKQPDPAKFREKLAIKVFRETARYDSAIDTFLSGRLLEETRRHLTLRQTQSLRYGENPHQSAQLFEYENSSGVLSGAEVISGKEMSYNNFLDADAALSFILDCPKDIFSACVVKHTNPCGAAIHPDPFTALDLAWEGDPVSAFGGIVAVNQTFDLRCAEFFKGDSVSHLAYQIIDGKEVGVPQSTGKFTEVILAPEFTPEAIEFLTSKSKALRLIRYNPKVIRDSYRYREIFGGLLRQSADEKTHSELTCPTRRKLSDFSPRLIEFGIQCVKHAKSNTIVLVSQSEGGCRLIGLGAGQPNRIDSLRKLAVPKCKENLEREYKKKSIREDWDSWSKQEIGKCLMVSDAFFPFSDTVEIAAANGIQNILQPGGSRKDEDSIAACDRFGIAMGLTGVRHFNH